MKTVPKIKRRKKNLKMLLRYWRLKLKLKSQHLKLTAEESAFETDKEKNLKILPKES